MIKSKATIPVVDSLLKEIDFKIVFAVNYDLNHVISIRRQLNKNLVFEHQEVEGLTEKEN